VSSDNDVIQPGETRAEIMILVGDQASIMLDADERDEGPPCLCIQGNGVQLLFYPHGWYEIGEVRQCDLDRAGDLVIDVTRWRDAIFRKLKAQRAEADRLATLKEAEEREAERAAEREEGPAEDMEPERPRRHEVI
jgi:hypothetical protein